MVESAMQDSERVVILRSHGASLRFSTNSARLCQFLMNDPFVKHHIPNVEFDDTEAAAAFGLAGGSRIVDYEIAFHEHPMWPTASFDHRQRRLCVEGMLGRDYEEIMFVFNSLQFFARMHQERHLFGLHCGGITYGSEAILILGDTEAGKSTTTAMLCARYDASYLCDERAIVIPRSDVSMDWVGGNTVLRVRSIDGLEWTDLEMKFEDVTERSVARHKRCFEVKSVWRRALPIRHIVFVRLTDHVREMRRSHRPSSGYQLFAALSEDIHGTWAPILAAQYAMPSLDSEELAQKRLAAALSLSRGDVEFWTCRGEVRYVSDMIAQLATR